MWDAIFILGWIFAIILVLLLPRSFNPADERYTSSLFQGVSMLFLLTALILQRFAGLSTTGFALMMIPTVLFMFTAVFLHLRNKRHN